jgi:hypothetical protein
VLGIALARITVAEQIDRERLAASPMFASVYVRKEAELVPPIEIARKLSRGEVNCFEAAARTGRYCETFPPESLADDVFPTWADGAALLPRSTRGIIHRGRSIDYAVRAVAPRR